MLSFNRLHFSNFNTHTNKELFSSFEQKMFVQGLLSLSNVVLIPILTDFVAIEDLAALDSALCNGELREVFMWIMSSDMFVHTGCMEQQSKKYFQWLIMKQLKVKKVNLSSIVTNRMVDSLIPYLSKIRIIDIKMPFSSVLIKILQGVQCLVTTLNLSFSHSMLDENFFELLPFLNDLSTICISYASISNVAISQLVECCPGLTDIEVYGCQKLDSTHVRSFADYGTKMKSLILQEHLATGDFQCVISKCIVLATLDVLSVKFDMECACSLSNCSQLQTLVLSDCDLSDDMVSKILQKMSLLKQLDVPHNAKLTDVSLTTIASCCPMLESVILMDCELVTQNGVKDIANGCKKLELINLSECKDVDESILNWIFLECPLLHSIYLQRLGGQKYLNIANVLQQRSSTIEALEFNSINSLDADLYSARDQMLGLLTVKLLDATRNRLSTLTVQRLDECILTGDDFTQLLYQFSYLRRLILSGSAVYKPDLFNLPQLCPLIEALGLYLDDVCGIGRECCLALIRYYSMQLKELWLIDNANQLVDEVMSQLVEHVFNLRVLQIKTEARNFDYSLLLQNCQQLRTLDLSSNGLTDIMLVKGLKVFGHQVTSLSVSKCAQLSPSIVEEISNYCLLLKYFNCKGCKLLTKSEELLRLVQCCEHLETVAYGYPPLVYNKYKCEAL